MKKGKRSRQSCHVFKRNVAKLSGSSPNKKQPYKKRERTICPQSWHTCQSCLSLHSPCIFLLWNLGDPRKLFLIELSLDLQWAAEDGEPGGVGRRWSVSFVPGVGGGRRKSAVIVPL